jgi:hypothetical protein
VRSAQVEPGGDALGEDTALLGWQTASGHHDCRELLIVEREQGGGDPSKPYLVEFLSRIGSH